ncbi:MAG: excinuclease ABC subunit UvrA [Gemmataceae bacterium]
MTLVTMPSIPLRGVRVHNLRSVDVDVPLGKLTVVTGVSGAGKSSLVFDTLHAEAQRRYLQSFSTTVRQYLERLERPAADAIGDLPPAVAIGQAMPKPGPRSVVGGWSELGDTLGRLWSRAGVLHCLRCGQPARAQGPQDVERVIDSLPHGVRLSLGFASVPESDAAVWGASLREEGFVRVWIAGAIHRLDEPLPPSDRAIVLVDRFEVGKQAPARLRESIELAFQRGKGTLELLSDDRAWTFDCRLRCSRCDIVYAPLEPALFDLQRPRGLCPTCAGDRTMGDAACPDCSGTGRNPEALAVRLGDLSWLECVTLPFGSLRARLAGMAEAAHWRTGCCCKTRLERSARSSAPPPLPDARPPGRDLSIGETKRIQLAAALAARLVQALYLIDEPTTGLHPRDTEALLTELRRLRDAGNTVVVIEHDRDVLHGADHIIDLGPGAGQDGGRVVYQGTPAGMEESEQAAESLTLAHLKNEPEIRDARTPRRPEGVIRLRGARTHNLQDLTVDFPLGVLCVVTGVSGAGKNSLVAHTLYPALARVKKKKPPPNPATRYDDLAGATRVEDVVLFDQTPLQRSARSNPATYLKIFDDIRDLYAETTDARIRNLGPGAFSFNQPGGRCEACAGQGVQTVDMHFLADVAVVCPECRGRRFMPDLLKIKVRNLDIAEALDLTVREAFRFFRAQPAIEKRLKLLLDVGLDYLRLGQPTQTLSGGECQRLKLAGQLAATRKSRCLFLLLEPTAGLHPADVTRLLDCFDGLVQAGHSLIVVEHDLDVIRSADHIIDLGPEAGAAGGRIVVAGTPEQVALTAASWTGRRLRNDE